MNKTTEALKLAEEALESCNSGKWSMSFDEIDVERALAAIREALAEPEITTPDVCGEVCARAKLCYGCGKAFDEALADHIADAGKVIAEPVKQEPIDDELKAKLDAFSDLKTILFEPERWTVSEHATYFGFFCWGWKYAKKPYAAPVSAPKQEPVAFRVHPFDYGVGHEGVYAMTMRLEQVEAWKRKGWVVEPLYAAPVSAKREWVELPDYEIVMLYAESPMCDSEMIAFARDVIAAFKEKNT